METDITKCDFYYSCGGQAYCSVGTYYAEECEGNPDCYFKQLQQLKQENEKLRKQLADKHLDYESEYNRKLEEKEYRTNLEKKLEKIKDICEENKYNGDTYDWTDVLANDILQIIEGE